MITDSLASRGYIGLSRCSSLTPWFNLHFIGHVFNLDKDEYTYAKVLYVIKEFVNVHKEWHEIEKAY